MVAVSLCPNAECGWLSVPFYCYQKGTWVFVDNAILTFCAKLSTNVRENRRFWILFVYSLIGANHANTIARFANVYNIVVQNDINRPW